MIIGLNVLHNYRIQIISQDLPYYLFWFCKEYKYILEKRTHKWIATETESGWYKDINLVCDDSILLLRNISKNITSQIIIYRE